MVEVSYDKTIASFKYGIKNPRWLYRFLFIIELIMVVLFVIVNIVVVFTEPYDVFLESFKYLCIAVGVISIILSPVLVIYLRERIVIKKGIMRCLCADDAKLMTVVPFETSSIPRSMYKIGVKFSYGDSKVTMISRHYGYSKNYIGCKVRIVYSPSCDDVVVLKKEK